MFNSKSKRQKVLESLNWQFYDDSLFDESDSDKDVQKKMDKQKELIIIDNEEEELHSHAKSNFKETVLESNNNSEQLVDFSSDNVNSFNLENSFDKDIIDKNCKSGNFF